MHTCMTERKHICIMQHAPYRSMGTSISLWLKNQFSARGSLLTSGSQVCCNPANIK